MISTTMWMCRLHSAKSMMCPPILPNAVAEHAMALLYFVRRIHKAYNRTRDGTFSLSGFDLHGKTVGVIGTGRIGSIVTDICRYDHVPLKDSGIEYVSLDALFQRSDVTSLHCPLTDETRHMISTETIGTMKKGVGILNTSRGALIDGDALLEGIKARCGLPGCV